MSQSPLCVEEPPELKPSPASTPSRSSSRSVTPFDGDVALLASDFEYRVELSPVTPLLSSPSMPASPSPLTLQGRNGAQIKYAEMRRNRLSACSLSSAISDPEASEDEERRQSTSTPPPKFIVDSLINAEKVFVKPAGHVHAPIPFKLSTALEHAQDAATAATSAPEGVTDSNSHVENSGGEESPTRGHARTVLKTSSHSAFHTTAHDEPTK